MIRLTIWKFWKKYSYKKGQMPNSYMQHIIMSIFDLDIVKYMYIKHSYMGRCGLDGVCPHGP